MGQLRRPSQPRHPFARDHRAGAEGETRGLSFEGANPRHAHEWKIFREVRLPPGKILIPGVIDSTTTSSTPGARSRAVCNYAIVVGRENVIAGTDCGFATSALDDMIFPSIAWAKLCALVEGARLASKALW